MRDLRGTLPTIGSYGLRPLAGITGVVLHYTAGAVNATPIGVAAYQISAAAAQQTGTGRPFPAIAYTFLVTSDGVANLCHDLAAETWHAGPLNATRIGICYTGNVRPNRDQIRGLAEAIEWCQSQLGWQLTISGHKDHMGADCPGPEWPAWLGEVRAQLGGHAGGQEPAQAAPGTTKGGSEGIAKFLVAAGIVYAAVSLIDEL